MKNIKLFTIVVITLFMANMVYAGFASTYLPKEDGKLILEIEPGVVSDYFIYPQNLGEEKQLIKIVLNDPNNTVQNLLEESYEIMPDTQSDEFPIKLEIKVPRGTLAGTSFPVSYEILTAEGDVEKGLVSFSPIGFEKTFYIRVKELEKNNSLLYWIIGVIIVLVIIIFISYIIIKKKSKKETNGGTYEISQ